MSNKDNSSFEETLNSLEQIPGLVKNNIEINNKIETKITENNSSLNRIVSKFSSVITEINDLNKAINTLNVKELEKVAENLNTILIPLQADLKKILLEEVFKNVEPILKNTILNSLNPVLADEFKKSTESIIGQYKNEITGHNQLLLDSIKNNAEDIKELNSNRIEIKEDLQELKNIIEHDKNDRDKQNSNFEDIGKQFNKDLRQYKFVSSGEYHFYNNIAFFLLGIVFTLFPLYAGAGIKNIYGNLIMVISICFTIFKGIMIYRIGTNEDEYNFKLADKDLFLKSLKNIFLRVIELFFILVLYLIIGFLITVLLSWIFAYFNNVFKPNINIPYAITIKIIEAIKQYKMYSTIFILILGYFPFFSVEKIMKYREKSNYEDNGYIVSYIGLIILSLAIIYYLYQFLPRFIFFYKL